MSETPRYCVLYSLGKGGMGEVFLADDTQLGRKVAIKFLADGATNDSRALDRLYREARSAAALDHPFICKIYEITEVEGNQVAQQRPGRQAPRWSVMAAACLSVLPLWGAPTLGRMPWS